MSARATALESPLNRASLMRPHATADRDVLTVTDRRHVLWVVLPRYQRRVRAPHRLLTHHQSPSSTLPLLSFKGVPTTRAVTTNDLRITYPSRFQNPM